MALPIPPGSLAGPSAAGLAPGTRPAAPGSPPVNRAGSRAYTRRSLFNLFFWLLTGDVLFIFVDQLEPRVLPILLRIHGATDSQIAMIVGSFAALVNLFVNPVVSYRSDRKRSRWGRRIPYLAWATPFVALFLALTPFAPELAAAAMGVRWVAGILQAAPWTPVVLMFGILVLLYQLFEKVISAIYFYLFRDVVPVTHAGRFFTLFRVFGGVATFAMNYWLVGLAAVYPRQVFGAIAAAYLVGFLAMCWFVREGEYPDPEEPRQAARPIGGLGWARGIRTFARESYRSPIYLWTYFTRAMINGSAGAMAFVIFFARDELGLTYDRAGKLMAWASFAWLVVAFPLGRLLDRWGSVRILTIALWILGWAYTASFLGIVGDKSFLVFSTLSGVAYWIVLLAQIVLVQQIFNPARMGQLCSANVIVQSLLVGVLVSPLVGWVLRLLGDLQVRVPLPSGGELAIGRYRFVYVLLAAMTFTALVGVKQLRRHWEQHGGPHGYRPPPIA